MIPTYNMHRHKNYVNLINYITISTRPFFLVQRVPEMCTILSLFKILFYVECVNKTITMENNKCGSDSGINSKKQ